MAILRREQHRKMPWSNGGGSTWEVLREPALADLGAVNLRLSFAEIDQAGAFSSFPGIDRVLTLVRGGVLTLAVDGRETTLRAGESLVFAGEAEVTSQLSESSIDFNVMTRRGVCEAEVEVHALDAAGLALMPGPGETLHLAVLDGLTRLSMPGQPDTDLAPLDVVTGLSRGSRMVPLPVSTVALVRVHRMTG